MFPYSMNKLRLHFNDVAANQMWETIESGNNGQDQILQIVYNCKKVKQEMMNDEIRIKTSVTSLNSVDYVKEGRSLFNSLISICSNEQATERDELESYSKIYNIH